MRTLSIRLALTLLCAALSAKVASADPMVPAAPPAPPRGPANGMVESDSTGSGKVDFRAYYDARGQIAQEQLDYDHDGKMDTFYYYKGGILQRVEIDTKGTGKIDLWVYLLNGTYIQKYERDTTGSGKPDVVKVYGQ